jgi:trans-aconitate 2-methyltransferase
MVKTQKLFENFYNAQEEIKRKWALETLTSLPFKDNQVILQIGSSDGFLTSILSTLVPNGKVEGIELDKTLFQKSIDEVKQPNITFINEGIDTFNKENFYDCVLAFNTLFQASDISLSLKNIHNSMKSKGKFLATLHLINPKKSDGSLLKVMQDNRFNTHFSLDPFMVKDELEAYFKTLLENLGFSSINIKVSTLNHVFESENDIKKWLNFFIEQSSLNSDEAQYFIDECLKGLKQVLKEGDEPNKIYFSELRIEAKKP